MMERIEPGTLNGVTENIELLARVFPQVVTEIEGESGNIERAVDFDALRDLLGDVAEGNRERYQFTWPGKTEAKAEARRPISKTMRPVPKKSVDWDTTENLYIEGDNLDALKLLKETYAGKVKLIYIDPPYNTGHDFVYDDDFAKTRGEYDAESGEYDKDGGRLVANTESNGRFHSDWCSMMYPRLLLARELLVADGFIFMSIDDNEVKNARAICDEIFSVNQFVAQIAWKRKKEISNDSKNIAIQGEYILVYSKSDEARLNNEPLSADYIQKSFNPPTNDFPLGKWRPVPITVSAGLGGGGYTYEIVTPSGKKHRRLWAYPEASYKSLLESGRVYFGKNGDAVPQRVMYAHESKGQPTSNYWDNVATNKEGKKRILELFGVNAFDTPKPVSLIKRIVSLVAPDEPMIVVDFFAGSSVTAEAVMQFNHETHSSHSCISVQIAEICNEKNESVKEGLFTVAEIGEERIRRAGKKIVAEIDEANKQLELGASPKTYPDLGFRVLTIDASNMKDTYFAPEDTDQERLLDVVDSLKEGRSSLDLLFEILPKFRIPYSAKIEERELCGKKCFIVNDNQLIACFDVNVGVDTIEAIAKFEPVYAVMRDASMVDDATQANFEELFKTYSPDTVRRVI